MVKKILTICSIVTVLSSCTFIPPNDLDKPDYRNIRVTDIPPPESCKYIGEVSGSQGNWFSGMFTSNVYLVMGARNSIRNQAGKYNANYVYTGDLKTIGPGFITGVNYSTVMAEAYKCTDADEPEPNRIIQRRCGYFSFCLYDGESTLVKEQKKPSNLDIQGETSKKMKGTAKKANNTTHE